jgi:hypothetical protein
MAASLTAVEDEQPKSRRNQMTEPTEPDESTLEAEDVDAQHAHSADRAPTAEESAAAERGLKEAGGDLDDVAEHYEEMTELGARVKGEGEIT